MEQSITRLVFEMECGSIPHRDMVINMFNFVRMMCKYVCLYVLFSHKCRVNNVG